MKQYSPTDFSRKAEKALFFKNANEEVEFFFFFSAGRTII